MGDTIFAEQVVTIYNKTLTDANTEYSQALPDECSHLAFQCRTAVDVRFAFVTGKVATPTAPYFTLKAGGLYYITAVALKGATLYLASATAGVVVEIEAWS